MHLLYLSSHRSISGNGGPTKQIGDVEHLRLRVPDVGQLTELDTLTKLLTERVASLMRRDLPEQVRITLGRSYLPEWQVAIPFHRNWLSGAMLQADYQRTVISEVLLKLMKFKAQRERTGVSRG